MKPPKMVIWYDSYKLAPDENGKWVWTGAFVEVEVCSLNIRTGTMRVRTVEKIRWSDTHNDVPEIKSWNTPIDVFWEKFELRERMK